MGAKFSKFMMRFDIFGHPISVHFKGEETYKTRLGVFVSICVLAFMTFNFVNLVTVFMDGSR